MRVATRQIGGALAECTKIECPVEVNLPELASTDFETIAVVLMQPKVLNVGPNLVAIDGNNLYPAILTAQYALNVDKTDESMIKAGAAIGEAFRSFVFTKKQIKAKIDFETYFFLRGFLR